MAGPNPHRPFSPAEIAKREQLANYLDACSEDDLIEEILMPLFRQLGFIESLLADTKIKRSNMAKTFG